MNKQTFKIALIGVGSMGRRHLEALLKSDLSLEIFCLDQSRESLAKAKEVISLKQGSEKTKILFSSKIDDLPSKVDVAIIATSSDVRAEIIVNLLHKKNVKYQILEKVLFQKISDFERISNLIKRKKIKTWVNCPRRMWPVYQNIKKNLHQSSRTEVIVNGSNFGLASNLIHFLDLSSYLSGSTKATIYTDLLDKKVLKSKRKGFIELTGNIFGNFENKLLFSITSFYKGKSPITVEIINENARVIVNETANSVSQFTSGDKVKVKKIKIPFQSELTHIAIEQILLKGKCDLVEFKDSLPVHLSMLNAFNRFLNQSEEWKIT